MTKKEYMEFHKATCERMHEITVAKNADYTSNGDDPFFNFRTVENMGVCSAEVGLVTRIMDKLSRVASFLKNSDMKVKDESIKDTLLDGANYLIILAAVIEEKNRKEALSKGEV